MLVELGVGEPYPYDFWVGCGGGGEVILPEQSGTERKELGARGRGNGPEC